MKSCNLLLLHYIKEITFLFLSSKLIKVVRFENEYLYYTADAVNALKTNCCNLLLQIMPEIKVPKIIIL